MLYAFGSNGSGQLGLGHTDDTSTPEPIQIEGNRPPWQVTQLAAGGNHTVMLCNDGKVRVTGNNEDGRCGLKSFPKLTHPTEMPLPLDDKTGEPVEVRQVAATWSSTALLTTEGRIYVCGTGTAGELGVGFGATNCTALTKLPFFAPEGTKIDFLTSGMAHTIAILSNGDVYGWGNGRKGQLGAKVLGCIDRSSLTLPIREIL